MRQLLYTTRVICCKLPLGDRTTKRLIDVAGAAGGLLFFLPAMALVALAILLEDGFPLLFRRSGSANARRPFTILKFRSMRDGADHARRPGPARHRPRRAAAIHQHVARRDERGRAASAGRQPTSRDWAGATPRYDFRWRVPPGLTGLAQVMGTGSPGLSLSLDRAYLVRRSLLLDVRLIALSFAINALGKKRVRMMLARRSGPWQE